MSEIKTYWMLAEYGNLRFAYSIPPITSVFGVGRAFLPHRRCFAVFELHEKKNYSYIFWTN